LSRARRLALGVALAGLVAAAAPAQGTAACTVRKSLEAIVDDSASMEATDSHRLRAAGLKLIMSTPGNEPKALGAIEFGDRADPIFGPGPIGPNRTAFSRALDQKVRADDIGTNYNAAFDLARAHDPSADARLFITDGGHNSGDYANGHRGGPPTYTIGVGFLTGADQGRLKAIAAETGGFYRAAQEDIDLQAAMNDVNAAINCQTAPKRVTDTFRRKGSKTHRLTVAKGVRSIRLVLSWASPNDSFGIGRFRQASGHKPKLRTRRGKTFVTLRLSGLKRGKLSYRVSKLNAGGAALVTQASRRRRG
jgi:hypothetical protein